MTKAQIDRRKFAGLLLTEFPELRDDFIRLLTAELH
jgi:hypothetical protein